MRKCIYFTAFLTKQIILPGITALLQDSSANGRVPLEITALLQDGLNVQSQSGHQLCRMDQMRDAKAAGSCLLVIRIRP
jgi:hypothetical protein